MQLKWINNVFFNKTVQWLNIFYHFQHYLYCCSTIIFNPRLILYFIAIFLQSHQLKLFQQLSYIYVEKRIKTGNLQGLRISRSGKAVPLVSMFTYHTCWQKRESYMKLLGLGKVTFITMYNGKSELIARPCGLSAHLIGKSTWCFKP